MSHDSSTTVSAPGRLHFGLFSVGDAVSRQFGGIGLMVKEPRTIVRVSAADGFRFSGQQKDTCMVAAQNWFDAFAMPSNLTAGSLKELPVHIEALQMPPRHAGLGSGTQIALSTATALNQFFGLAHPSIQELSAAVQRAKRSAIGSHGFIEGGFLVDQGKTSNQSFASLDFQIDFPQDWPIVLMFSDQTKGLAGEQEQAAFEQIPATSQAQYAAMRDIVHAKIVPALVQANYRQFADSLFEFGHRSGLYFKTVQGGAYNGPSVKALVDHARQFGVPAVGQTSWGPCVFAIAKDIAVAQRLAEDVRQKFGPNCRTEITHADNNGTLINGRANLLGRSSVTNRLGL